MDEDLAEFIGIYIGDGNLTIREAKNSYEFKFVGNPSCDAPYFENYVSKLASSILGRKIKARTMDKGRSVGIYFCSKELAEQFAVLGFPGGPKAERISIPNEIMESEKLRIACIRGIFDTDGCFTLKRRGRQEPYYPVITFSMKNRMVMSQISSALHLSNIPHSISFDICNKDSRTGKTYSKHYLSIYGFKNVSKWFSIFGSSNPKSVSRLKLLKKKIAGGGFEPPIFTPQTG